LAAQQSWRHNLRVFGEAESHLLPTTLSNVKQFFLFRLSAQDARMIAVS